MAEIALVSAKRTRLQQWAKEGNRNAQTALELTENPERFLSTVQIGITLVGVFSGAFGGASLSKYLAPLLEPLPLLGARAETVAFAIIVMLITYFSLIIGELVPKNLALRNPEKIAVAMAAPMAGLSRIAMPLVWLLETSTRLLLKIMGSTESPNSGPSREDVQVLVRQGFITGEVKPEENEMLNGIFELQDTLAEEIMLPRPKVTFLPADATQEQVWQQIRLSKQNVFPIYEGSRDSICGLVSIRALYSALWLNEKNMSLRTIMQPPAYVAENEPALQLMKTLRGTSLGAALVTDEFGTIRGLITIDDVVEEVIGDYRKGLRESQCIKELHADQWLADGGIEIDEFVRTFPELEEAVEGEEEAFQTLAGFIFHHLDRLPAEGDRFVIEGLDFLIADMDQQRIDKVIISRVAQPANEVEPSAAL